MERTYKICTICKKEKYNLYHGRCPACNLKKKKSELQNQIKKEERLAKLRKDDFNENMTQTNPDLLKLKSIFMKDNKKQIKDLAGK